MANSNTIEEIAYFCREENTFGALLLSGGWGCGKTYLLEHDLPDCLGDDFALIRISLFGETSVEAVRKKIQKAYFNKILENVGCISEEEAGASANAWIYKSSELTGVEKIFALNPSDYIRLEPTIAGRSVVLIFDDLERCHLSQSEILGCINEYCENLHLKTIIVANEDKIKDWQTNKTKLLEEGKKDFLAYSEIKEKIIVRTVRLEADYEQIIGNIFDNYHTSTAGYAEFLQYSRPEVLALIDDCEVKNIRSLKCGFQDFERIFLLCRGEELPDEEILRYFSSFVLFVLMAKGGRISKSDIYGYILNKLQEKYPGHYAERYMPNCMKDWVLSGAWKQEVVLAEIRKNTELQRTTEPENLIRSLKLMEMDDDILTAGWAPFLELAYGGKLSLEEYVLLIRNLADARSYLFTWPVEPNMYRLNQGVEQAFRIICETEDDQLRLENRLDDSTLKKCTDAERELYGRIIFFKDSGAWRYGSNRSRILAALAGGSEKEIFKCRRYDTDRFDDEMGEAVIAHYMGLDNQKRLAFIDILRMILRNCSGNCNYADAATKASIEKLRDRALAVRRTEAEKPLKAITTDYMIAQIDEILDLWRRKA